MQKVYLFFYRLLSNEGNISFKKIELTVNGEVTHINQFKQFEDYILTQHTNSTLVEITGCMYLREIKTEEDAERKTVTTRKNKRA